MSTGVPTGPSVRPIELLAGGKVDAFLAIAPEPQEARARHLGHTLINGAADRLWSQYFCRMLGDHRDFVRNYPIATMRVLRAILKPADLCADRGPQRASSSHNPLGGMVMIAKLRPIRPLASVSSAGLASPIKTRSATAIAYDAASSTREVQG